MEKTLGKIARLPTKEVMNCEGIRHCWVTEEKWKLILFD
jgi:hypothetical protein